MPRRIDQLYYELEMRDAQFRAATREAAAALAQLSQAATKVGAPVGAMHGSMQLAATSTKRMGTAVDQTSQSLRGLRQLLQSLGIAFGIRQLVEYADGWTMVQGRLGLVTRSSAELTAVTEKLFSMAQQTRTSFEATANLYARLARSTRQLGLSQQDLLTITRAVNQSFVISGASAGEAQAALVQLGQALASGTLRGDELRSVLEQAPRLARAIAESMGITVGQLRDLGAAGKLTSNEIARAILRQADVINTEFAKIPTTIGQAFTQVTNALQKFIGESSRATAAGKTMAEVLKLIADNIALIADALLVLGIGKAASVVGRFTTRISAAAAEGTLLSKVLGRLGGPAVAIALGGITAVNTALAVSESNLKKAREEADRFKEAMRDLSPRELQAILAELDRRIERNQDILNGVRPFTERDPATGREVVRPLTAGRVRQLEDETAALLKNRQAIRELADEQAKAAKKAKEAAEAERKAAEDRAAAHAKALEPVRAQIRALQFDASQPDALAKLRHELQGLLEEARKAGATAAELQRFKEELQGVYAVALEARGKALSDQLADELAALTPTLVDDMTRALEKFKRTMQEGLANGIISREDYERLVALKEQLIAIQGEREDLEAFLAQVRQRENEARPEDFAELTRRENLLRMQLAETHELAAQKKLQELIKEIEEERERLVKGRTTTERQATDQARQDWEEALRRAQDQARAIKESAEGALELGRAFGLFSDETERALRNLLDIATGIGPLVEALKGGRFGEIVGAALPVVGGLAGLASSIFGESPEEKQRRLELRKNTEALTNLTLHIGDLATSSAPVGNITRALQVLNTMSEAEIKVDTTLYDRQGLTAAFRKVGLSMADLEELAESFNITLNDSAESWVQLRDALRHADLSAYTDTFAGALQQLHDSFEVYDITDPVEKLRRSVQQLRSTVYDPQRGIPAITNALRGLDVGNATDRARAIENLQRLFEDLARGRVATTQLGGASLTDARQFIIELLGELRAADEAAGGAPGGPAGTGGFSIDRSITEVTGNRLAGILTTMSLYEQQTAENTALIARLLGGTAPPPVVTPPALPAGGLTGGRAADVAAQLRALMDALPRLLASGGVHVAVDVNQLVIHGEGDERALREAGTAIGSGVLRAINQGLGEMALREQRARGDVLLT